MPAEPVKIGPFSAGLNTKSDGSTIPDNALVECLNWELDLDGSLKSRPPAVTAGSAMPLAAGGNPTLIGVFVAPGAAELLIANDGATSTYYFTGSGWSLITDTIAATAMCQFNGKAWLLSGESAVNPGGTWTPTDGFVPDSTIPRGDVVVAHKSRLWIVRGKDALVNGTRIYYSQVQGQTPFFKPTPDFFDIGQGDGQNIVTISVYYESILVFRTNSIHTFQYTSDPAGGAVKILVPGVGIDSKECLAVNEGTFYFQYRGSAYEISNGRANIINKALDFTSSNRTGIVSPYSVSVFHERVVFQFWDTSYVFNLNTQTWTRWRSAAFKSFGRFWTRPPSEDTAEVVCFSNSVVPTGGGRAASLLSMQDAFSDRSEAMTCIAQTKNYDYETSTQFKGLKVWFVSGAWNGTIRAIASAINFTKRPTWGQIRSQHTWGTLRAQTWGSLSSDISSHTDIRVSTGHGPQRKEAKVGRAIKFKRVNFRVEFDVDGSSDTAPARLYYLTTHVRAGETIVKDVS